MKMNIKNREGDVRLEHGDFPCVFWAGVVARAEWKWGCFLSFLLLKRVTLSLTFSSH